MNKESVKNFIAHNNHNADPHNSIEDGLLVSQGRHVAASLKFQQSLRGCFGTYYFSHPVEMVQCSVKVAEDSYRLQARNRSITEPVGLLGGTRPRIIAFRYKRASEQIEFRPYWILKPPRSKSRRKKGRRRTVDAERGIGRREHDESDRSVEEMRVEEQELREHCITS